ncbi:MAG TPA: ferritin-like domain-containing protein [Gaiellaceae bacterium]|nr:ferritin-like domain-containing protein [Gaiellaceae bacterium]
MSEHDRTSAFGAAEDVHRLENVLADTSASPHSRSWLLKRAALGVGVVAAASPLGRALAATGTDTPQAVGVTAVTAEALAVTYLTALIGRLGSGLGAAEEPLRAANQAEQDHFAFLSGAGFTPLTTTFWIPDAAFDPAQVAATVETLETVFVNAYLIGVTVFANAGSADLARYAGEIAVVEAEHRALARQLQGKLPDNLAFERYTVGTLDAVVGELTATGIGFEERGSQPGAFYGYQGPSPSTVVPLDNDAPDQAVPFPQPMLVGATG